MDTAKPQLMDRPKAEAKHAASEASGAALVSALDAVLGVQADVALDAVPVPHRRVERWKYTPVAAWWKDVLAPGGEHRRCRRMRSQSRAGTGCLPPRIRQREVRRSSQ